MPSRYLLLSDIPPCSNYTGGVVLADQCRHLDPSSLVAFVVVNPAVTPELYPELANIPMEMVAKPNELWVHLKGTQEAIRGETYNAAVRCTELANQAVAFGKHHQVDAVWAVMEGQTIARMALRVARDLNVPLYTQVWDPLTWWLEAHDVDEVNGRHALRMFDEAIRNSRGVAVASEPMAEDYRRRYGVRAIPVINSQPPSVACSPEPHLLSPDRLTIGLAGQLYARDAWLSLIAGLESANWRIAHREVQIYYLGKVAPEEVPADRLVWGGWKSQPDAIRALSENADLLYCPYPFARSMEEVARLSFPSKLVMYAAAGRPIVCHAPWYSSAARYVAAAHAGVVSGDLNSDAIVSLMGWVAGDPQYYSELCAGARRAFAEGFTREKMLGNFHAVLEMERDLVGVHR